MKERLQKILSQAGVCSRRRAEDYLRENRVKVNGITAMLGQSADPELDRIELDGTELAFPAAHTYLMLNKPRGCVTTLSDERDRRTVAQLVSDCPARVWPVGRLDYDSEGLLLMTDDGALTQLLTHPAHGVEKEYRVRVSGDVERALPRLRAPMVLDGEAMEADRVERTGRDLLTIVIHQGKNRQVRRMCDAAGLEVLRLKRVREGPLTLGDLHTGCWRALTRAEVSLLKALVLQEPGGENCK